jgi:hypothetical protein
MALFSSKKTTTNLSTTNVFTDNSANAAEGGLAVGAGAQVSITTADPDVAKTAIVAQHATAGAALDTTASVAGAALNTTANVAGAALGGMERTAGLSIAAQNQLATHALDTNAALVTHTTNTLFGLADVAARERKDVLDTTQLALRNQQGTADQLAQLAASALERSQTPDSQITKTLLYVVGGVAVLFGLLALRRR